MSNTPEAPHRRLEGKSGLFAALVTVAILVGGMVEIIPLLTVPGASSAEQMGVEPYTPLELVGRDIYVREGCYNCHSQMVRPMRSDTLRFGDWSHSYEYVYDRPFQFGSRRIGPDVHREGGRYNDAWHYQHFRDPRTTSPGSIMPAYGWLLESQIDAEDVLDSIDAMRSLGVAYPQWTEQEVASELQREGEYIVARLAQTNIQVAWDDEVVALTAYLQSLGRNRPRGEDLAGVALGAFLYDDLNCRRCHGEDGSRAGENPNAAQPILALDTLATRLGFTTDQEVAAAVALLSDNDPGNRGDESLSPRLEATRQAIYYGSIVAPVDPAGAQPLQMPNYGYRINRRSVDALIAYMLTMSQRGTAP